MLKIFNWYGLVYTVYRRCHITMVVSGNEKVICKWYDPEFAHKQESGKHRKLSRLS